MSATELQPCSVTAAIFCCASIATPEGSGDAEQPVTSTLCSTVKSEALLRLLPESKTSRVNRRAEESREGGTIAVKIRLLTNVVLSAIPSRRATELVEKP